MHASWLNRIEIYNSIIQRKVMTANDFTDLDEAERRLFAFKRHHEVAATPLEWKFTRADLRKLMERPESKDLVAAAGSVQNALANLCQSA